MSDSTASLEKAYRKVVTAWALYDWANSAFATTVVAAVFPIFYRNVAAADLPPVTASSYFGYTNSIAMLLVALLAPILGAIADYRGSRKRFLGTFAFVGILFTVAMVFLRTGDWFLASCLFIGGNVGWAGANIFYDSLLPHVARAEDLDRVSARGYALGYLGGGLLLALNLVMIKPNLIGLKKFPGVPDSDWAVRLSFVSVAVWWATFSIPLFRRVSEPPAAGSGHEKQNPVRAGFQRIRHTFRDIRRYRDLFTFLLAFWLYNDGIGTIIHMAAIFGKEIGISDGHLIGALLMTQFAGIPFAIAFGRLAGWLGTKRSIMLALGGYTVIAIGGFFMQTALHFWLLALAVATVQGGAQALSRSLYGSMTPKAKTSEFFGFYDVSSKFAGILGPMVFAVVGQMTGSSRLSILALIVFFVGGALLLLNVNENEGIRIARDEDATAQSRSL